jgi:hypothetical protein
VLNVRLRLPQHWSDDDLLEASAVTVNGAPLSGSRLAAPAAAAGGVLDVVVDLIARQARPSRAPVLAAADPHAPTATERRSLFAPPAPALASAWRAGTTVQLSVTGVAPGGRWHVYRDGAWRASGAADQPYRERLADPHHTVCYAATAEAPSGGLRSLPSADLCLEGADSRHSFTAGSGALASPDGHPLATAGVEQLYADWGEPQQRLRLSFEPRVSGLQRLTLRYANASGPVNTGVTAAVKRVTVACAGAHAAEGGVLVMPHLSGGSFGQSTGVVFSANRGANCRIEIGDGFNMSYLGHFALYTGGRGGRDGPRNHADIVAAQIDAIERPRLTGH